MMASAGEEIGVNLAVSLHARDQGGARRDRAAQQEMAIEELLEACAAYPGANNAGASPSNM